MTSDRSDRTLTLPLSKGNGQGGAGAMVQGGSRTSGGQSGASSFAGNNGGPGRTRSLGSAGRARNLGSTGRARSLRGAGRARSLGDTGRERSLGGAGTASWPAEGSGADSETDSVGSRTEADSVGSWPGAASWPTASSWMASRPCGTEEAFLFRRNSRHNSLWGQCSVLGHLMECCSFIISGHAWKNECSQESCWTDYSRFVQLRNGWKWLHQLCIECSGLGRPLPSHPLLYHWLQNIWTWAWRGKMGRAVAADRLRRQRLGSLTAMEKDLLLLKFHLLEVTCIINHFPVSPGI